MSLSLLRQALVALELEPYDVECPWSPAQYRERATARVRLRGEIECIEREQARQREPIFRLVEIARAEEEG